MITKEKQTKEELREAQDLSENTEKEIGEDVTASHEEEQANDQGTPDEKETQEEKDPLTLAKQEAEEYKNKYLYKVAEFENYRKRTLKEKAELILNGGEKTISAILPVLDDMERAIANAETTEEIDVVKEGMTLIFNKFYKTLESLGVKKIETEGKDFDVDFHEAIAMVPGMGDDKKGKVIDCVQTGYTLNDKVIRHDKVAVGQ